jgi:hypothetical protein
LCLHPNDPVHLDILAEVCDRYMFMRKDEQRRSRLLFADTLPALIQDAAVRSYLGKLVTA